LAVSGPGASEEGGYQASTIRVDADTTGGDADLNLGVWEGGLNVWECSIDLFRHLAGIVDDQGSIEE
jgi:hypothetical protein